MLYYWGATSIEIPLIAFLKPKQNPEVVSTFGKCLSLFGSGTKQERIYRCEMFNHLVSILLNPTTTWVSYPEWKIELCYDKIFSRGKTKK